MKRVLIISPYFPPSNAADMQRVRMSLPYFHEFGWEVEVVAVDPKYTDHAKDDLLRLSIPGGIQIHWVKAFSKSLTKLLGLGSIAIRACWFYRQKVNRLLRSHKYDLIYFSTTQFPVCALGSYWKKKFGISYVIDLQDLWHSDYYQEKPRSQRPPKYWFSYRLNKYLESKAMAQVGGLISVSEAYISTLIKRYPKLKDVPAATIPFGFFEPDMAIARSHRNNFTDLLSPQTTNLVYIGRGGGDMHRAIAPLFKCLQKCMASGSDNYRNLRFYFIGTSYAPAGQGKPSIIPLAQSYHIADHVVEITNRISFYHTLLTLQQADALFIPGSDDPQYTASKLYPYLLTKKPLLAVFNDQSPALETLWKCGALNSYGYTNPLLDQQIKDFLEKLIAGTLDAPSANWHAIANYSALHMTSRQCELFDKVIS